jgi:hypothetical protein
MIKAEAAEWLVIVVRLYSVFLVEGGDETTAAAKSSFGP